MIKLGIGSTEHKTRVGLEMIKVIICDDDFSFAAQLRKDVREILKCLGHAAQIEVFQYPEEIPDPLLSHCDIAFLDIDFKGKNYTGIDIARIIRNNCNNAVIIFVTNYPQYAPEGYEVQAFRYLLKGELVLKLKAYLIQAVKHLDTTKQALNINVLGEIITIPLEEIGYIEAQLRMVDIHMIKEAPKCAAKYSFYSTISSLEESLEPKGFLRVQKSYLVNMRHVKRYQCNEVELTNGVVLKASKQLYAEQKKKYILWKGL